MSHQTRDRSAPQSRQPKTTGENAVFSIGKRPVSLVEFQAVLVGLYCLTCLCCSVSAFIWGSTGPTQSDVKLPLRRRTRPAATVSSTAVDATICTNTCTPPSAPAESWTPESTTLPTEPTVQTLPSESPLATPTPARADAPTPVDVPPPSQTPEPTAAMPSILPTPTIPLSYTEPPPAPMTLTITLSPSETPTPTLTLTPTPILADLHIDHVEPSGWDGEYVLIENRGTDSQNMTGWTLHNTTGQTYYFPTGFTLAGEARVRVWTKTGQDSSTNLYWASSAPIWNDKSDTAYLRDDTRSVVDTFSW
jgi:hypothetical protein